MPFVSKLLRAGNLFSQKNVVDRSYSFQKVSNQYASVTCSLFIQQV